MIHWKDWQKGYNADKIELEKKSKKSNKQYSKFKKRKQKNVISNSMLENLTTGIKLINFYKIIMLILINTNIL